MNPPLSHPLDTTAPAIAAKSLAIQQRPFNPQQIRSRRVQVHFSEDIPRVWLQNSAIKTQFMNGINLFIGEFEAFMVQTLQSHLPALDDPALQQQISGLISQELSHAYVHNAYNQTLQTQGYRFETYLKWIQFFFRRVLSQLGSVLSLASMAGFEHITATLAEIVLDSNVLEDAHPAMKRLWEWHAAEELEHQALVFEYLQACDRNYGVRCLGGLIGLAIVLWFSLSGMVLLLLQDQGWVCWKTVTDAIDLFFTGDRLIPRCFQRLLPYFKPDFYPTGSKTAHLGQQVLGQSFTLFQTSDRPHPPTPE